VSRTQFRWLLVFWLALIVGRLASPSTQLPSDVNAATHAAAAETFSTAAGKAYFVAVVGLSVAGFVGMLRTWRFAPHVFLAAYVVEFAGMPLAGWYAATGWQVMFEGLAGVLAGALFVAAVFGPAKQLFEGPRNAAA